MYLHRIKVGSRIYKRRGKMTEDQWYDWQWNVLKHHYFNDFTSLVEYDHFLGHLIACRIIFYGNIYTIIF